MLDGLVADLERGEMKREGGRTRMQRFRARHGDASQNASRDAHGDVTVTRHEPPPDGPPHTPLLSPPGGGHPTPTPPGSQGDPGPLLVVQDAPAPPLPRPPRYAEAVAAVYAHWRTYHPRSAPKLLPGALEYRRAVGALKAGHTAADLCGAIDGYHGDDFHCGDNDRGRKHLGLDLILRDEAHILAGIEMGESSPPPARPLAPEAWLVEVAACEDCRYHADLERTDPRAAPCQRHAENRPPQPTNGKPETRP